MSARDSDRSWLREHALGVFFGGLFLLALVHDPVPTFLAAALLGIADGPQLLAVFAIRHRETPLRSLSQVFTTAASLKIGCAAVGGAVAAPLLHSSPQLLLLVAAAVQLAAMGCAIAAGTPVRSPRPGRGIGRSSDG